MATNEEETKNKLNYEKEYKNALNSYYANKNEESLYQAYNLTRQAILSKTSLLDLIISYQKAFSDILKELLQHENEESFVKDGIEFLSEALIPFEMTFQGYEDTINQLKRKNQILEEERSKLDHLVNIMSSAIIVIDFVGDIKVFNSKLEYYYKKFFNYNINEAKNVNDLIKCVLTDKILECFFSNIDLQFEIEIEKDFFLKVSSNKLYNKKDEEKSFFSLIIEFQDISSFIQFDKMRNSFISMVAHELRNPISAIISSNKQIKKYSNKLKEEDILQLRNIIDMNSDLVLEIINDLTLVSRIDEKKLTITYAKFNLHESINKIINQLQGNISNKNIKILTTGTLNINVYSDISRIEQIIRIILDNAIKYSFNNSIIEIKVSTIEKNDKKVMIQIQDSGIGIKESDLNNLFQRFYRSPDVKKIQGTGLGLSIAKEMISMLKGEIKVLSKFGNGTVFSIIFPFSD